MKLFLLFSLLATSLMSADTFASGVPNLSMVASSDDDFSGNHGQTVHPMPQVNVPNFSLESGGEFEDDDRIHGA